jgi:hypothetical protein
VEIEPGQEADAFSFNSSMREADTHNRDAPASVYSPATLDSFNPRTVVENMALRKIKGFCGTIDEQGDYYSKVYAGNVSLTASITADYQGRFLIELIQNAYDAHPQDRSDGEIEVVLDTNASKYGTLYVANRGAGFSTKNVDALCDMGLSSKPPGESIGNKGLGFRSVHHVTDGRGQVLESGHRSECAQRYTSSFRN